MHDLFRNEAAAHGRSRAVGDTVIAQPLSLYIFAVIAFAFLAFGIAILAFGERSRTESASGYLIPAGGVVKVYPSQKGIVRTVHVREGAALNRGDLIA